jgi:hypothetical protein
VGLLAVVLQGVRVAQVLVEVFQDRVVERVVELEVHLLDGLFMISHNRRDGIGG